MYYSRLEKCSYPQIVMFNTYVVECSEQHMCEYCKLELNHPDKPHTGNKEKLLAEENARNITK